MNTSSRLCYLPQDSLDRSTAGLSQRAHEHVLFLRGSDGKFHIMIVNHVIRKPYRIGNMK